jgi:hypothetical protein
MKAVASADLYRDVATKLIDTNGDKNASDLAERVYY